MMVPVPALKPGVPHLQFASVPYVCVPKLWRSQLNLHRNSRHSIHPKMRVDASSSRRWTLPAGQNNKINLNSHRRNFFFRVFCAINLHNTGKEEDRIITEL